MTIMLYSTITHITRPPHFRHAQYFFINFRHTPRPQWANTHTHTLCLGANSSQRNPKHTRRRLHASVNQHQLYPPEEKNNVHTHYSSHHIIITITLNNRLSCLCRRGHVLHVSSLQRPPEASGWLSMLLLEPVRGRCATRMPWVEQTHHSKSTSRGRPSCAARTEPGHRAGESQVTETALAGGGVCVLTLETLHADTQTFTHVRLTHAHACTRTHTHTQQTEVRCQEQSFEGWPRANPARHRRGRQSRRDQSRKSR